jgi:hypothetical protein
VVVEAVALMGGGQSMPRVARRQSSYVTSGANGSDSVRFDEARKSGAPDSSSEAGAVSHAVFGCPNLRLAFALFAMACAAWLLLERLFDINPLSVSNAPHFLYQAQSLLHGRFDIVPPPIPTDVVLVHGKQYIVYPPMPAMLMMPGVAIFGLHFSDVLFTMLISALNLPLLYFVFEQARANGLTCRTSNENAVIALLLYFGSINMWLSLGGRMWFTAQIVCLTFTLGSLLLALRRQFTLSAVLLACAFFSRATVLLAFPLLIYLAWQDGGAGTELQRFIASLRARVPDWSAVPWRRMLPVCVVAMVALALFMLRNNLIFGSPLDSGYAVLIQQHYSVVKDGPFSVKYIPANILANFFAMPSITFSGPFDRHPAIDMLNGGEGISIFITTPLFLYLFWRNRTFSWLRAALWATIGLIVAAVLLFHAAGWYEFGARYLFDGYAYIFLLFILNETPVVVGGRRPNAVGWRIQVLGLLGIAINLLGANQFWTGRILHL